MKKFFLVIETSLLLLLGLSFSVPVYALTSGTVYGLDTMVLACSSGASSNRVSMYDNVLDFQGSMACSDTGIGTWDDNLGGIYGTVYLIETDIGLGGNPCAVLTKDDCILIGIDNSVINYVAGSPPSPPSGGGGGYIPIPSITEIIASTSDVSVPVTATLMQPVWLILGVIISVLLVGFLVSVFGKGFKKTMKGRL